MCFCVYLRFLDVIHFLFFILFKLINKLQLVCIFLFSMIFFKCYHFIVQKVLFLGCFNLLNIKFDVVSNSLDHFLTRSLELENPLLGFLSINERLSDKRVEASKILCTIVFEHSASVKILISTGT